MSASWCRHLSPGMVAAALLSVLLLVCYLFATALIIVSIVVQRLEESEEDRSHERALRVGTWTRWSMPVGAAFVLSGTVLVLWY